MRWTENMARMGNMRGSYKVLVGKSEVKRPLGKPTSRWEEKNKTDF